MINEKLVGTIAFGLRLPLIKEGDNLINAIVESYSEVGVVDGDVVGVTESVVARNAGMYVELEEVGKWLTKFKPSATHLVLVDPIFSRNRFIPILRGMLCAPNINKVTIMSREVDEVGNHIEHQITGVNYKNAYKECIEGAGKEFEWIDNNLFTWHNYAKSSNDLLVVDCRLHSDNHPFELSLQDIFKEKNSWGLLGMNAAGNNRLKLFPDKQYAQYFVNTLQKTVKERFGKDVDVMIYGDGAFKDPVSGIWEWADPVVSPAWTSGLDGSPAEIKLKNVIDSGMSEADICKEIKKNKGKCNQDLGTTPRRFVDLFGSAMDLISGSGDKGTPVVIIRNSRKKYTD